MSRDHYNELKAGFDAMTREREDKTFVEWWLRQRTINPYLTGKTLLSCEHFASRAWGERQEYINSLRRRLEHHGDYGPYKDEAIRILEAMIDELDKKIAELEG